MKDWKDYFDSNGLLVQKDKDGGDTPSHEGIARCLSSYGCSKYPTNLCTADLLKKLMNQENLLIRNPTRYTNPYDTDFGTSRDQYRGIVAAAMIYGHYLAISRMYEALPKNFLGLKKYPNGDFFSPEDLTIFTRNTQYWVGRAIGDFCTMVNSLLICFWVTKRYGKEYTSNDIDHIAVCISGYITKPTVFNKLARWIYRKFRPGGIQYALDSYFNGDNNPPVNELGNGTISYYFGDS